MSSENKQLPGPKGNFLLGKALDFQKDPLEFLLNVQEEFPAISGFRFAHLNMVMVAEPEYVRHVLQTNNKNYVKGIEYEHLKHVLGEGLLTSEGSFWLRQRRLAQPAFHRKKIAHFVDTMVSCTTDLVENWDKKEDKEVVDILPEMMRLTLDIVASTMFSTHVASQAPEIEQALGTVIHDAYTRIQSIINIPLWFPTPHNVDVKKKRETLQKVILEIIEDRRKSEGEFNDLLSMLMDARDEDTGEGMTDKQLLDELMTIFLAGHETTANALTWTFYLISQNAEVEAKLLAEVKAALGDENPTLESLMKLPYTLMVIKEAMRLYPPAWILGRTALAEDSIDGFRVGKGDNLLISPFALHRNPKHWDEPLEFKPERFENEKEFHKFLYFPFGGGPRLCIGNNFAQMEMQIALAMVIRSFRLTLKEGHVVEPEPIVTLRPKYGMKMHLEKR